MAIMLHPDHERLVTLAIATGAYESADEVIGRALELLHSEDDWLHDRQAGIHEKIERAFGQFDRDEFFSAEESRADMESRKSAWLAQRKCSKRTY